MNPPDDEQQPGPAVERESEPRLLTRPVANQSRWTPPATTPRQTTPRDPRGLPFFASWTSRRRPSDPRASQPPRAPRPRWPRWALLATLCLLLLAALVMVLDLRHAMTAALPTLDGDLTVPGLQNPVTVTRDAQGVPSISAATLNDLLFAQGYITASDRLWQMDGLRRHAAGQLAEILGPGLVEHDRRQRFLQLSEAATRAVAQLPPDQAAQLEAYARGVNAFIDSHRGSLPLEFRLLAYQPAPWSPRDSLLVSLAMWQDLSTEFPQKLNREALSAHLPADLLGDLYPVGSWRDQPPAGQSRDLTTPRIVEQIPLDPSQSRVHPPAALPAGPGAGQARPADLLAVSAALAGTDRCAGCRSGSNDWVVSGARSASGAPLLSNDMHLNLSIPDLWYEAALHTPATTASGSGDGLDVSGFTLPGVPFVIVGRNKHVAWGVTNLGADVQDLRLEHLRGSGENTEYQRPDGTWALALHHAEHIHVRGGRDLDLDVLSTVHAMGPDPANAMETPIISPLYPAERRDLSLAWPVYDPHAVTSPFLDIDAAPDGPSLVAAFASFGGPTLNMVWADTGGHIGYHAIGRIPVRGPAVQHPRSTLPILPVVPAGEPPPDEGSEGSEGSDSASVDPTAPPPAVRAGEPHLLLSAFHPARRRSRARARSASPVPERGRTRNTPPEPAATPELPLLPLPQPANYTVGSPISPLPVDAVDPAQAWSGYIGYGDLPSVTDPPGGLLATANSRIAPDDFPWAIANDWPDPFRTERIVHLLSGRTGLTPADMLAIENDVHSDVDQAMAQRIAYALDHASPQALRADTQRLHRAADLLRSWDGEMRPDSAGAALITTIKEILWPSLLIPQITAHDHGRTDSRHAATLVRLYTWNERTTALELLLQNQPARWLPPNFLTWNDFLATVTERALQAAEAPADLATWRYGQLHTIEIAHPLLGDQHLLSHLLGITATTGPQPAPGDGTTIKQIGAHFGPSERFTADLSSPDAATANLTTGESEDPRSPWYLDQFQPWLKGTTFVLPGLHPEATHTLRLLPR